MLHVVLDTNIFSRNPRRDSAPFRALVRLAKAGMLQIHMPAVVAQEFKTQLLEKIETPLKEMIAALKKLQRNTGDDEFGRFAVEAIEAAEAKLTGAKAAVEADFDGWLKSVNAVVHEISTEEAQGAFGRYFAGEPPFKNIKNRSDIPDAFVLMAVLNLVKEVGEVHFVVADDALRKAADDAEHVVTYESLDEFIQAPECQDALVRISADENRVINRARVVGRMPEIAERLKTLLESGMYSALDGRDVEDRRIPDDNNQAMIIGVGDVSEVVFDFANTEYYGEDDIGIPFEARVECRLNYAVFKADYCTLSDEKTEGMSIEERNRHYYDVEEDYDLRVTGVLTLQIDGDLLGDELDDPELDDVILGSDSEIEVQEIAVA